MATKLKSPPPVADITTEADHDRYVDLANSLFDYEEDRPRAYGGVIEGTKVKDLLERLANLTDTRERAKAMADAARQEVTSRWQETPEYTEALSAEARVDEARAALEAARNAGREAEDHYQQSLVGEDQEAAVAAKRALADCQTKLEFWGQRIKALEDLRTDARMASHDVEVRLLRAAGQKLRRQAEDLHRETLPRFGALLAEVMPDLLLTDEIDYYTRTWG